MPNAFAIIHTWPELKNAEYEVLQRVLGAARRIDAAVAVIDRNGKVIWSSPELNLVEGALLPPDSISFVLSLHFESGRVVDAYSYYALWQPGEFYHDFGYQRSIDKLTSYHDLLSCGSDMADAHGLHLLESLGREPLRPLPKLFHTLPEPFLAPRTDAASRLFYIGINWERIGRPRGRFHDVLATLDRLGLIDIYGPEMMMGVAPWGGFDCYRGELPFDGVSVKNAVNRAGICLVLSSAAHKRSGIMSNRLFEGLAGGAAIVASPHPLLERYFPGVVTIVDDTRGEEVLGQQIVEAVRAIRADPEAARRRTLEGQRILREQCSLEGSLEALFEQTASRRAHFEAGFLADADVTVLLTYFGASASELSDHIAQFARQKRCRVVLHVLCGARFVRRHGAAFADRAEGAIARVMLHGVAIDPATEAFDGPIPEPSATGPVVAGILARIDTPLFAFFGIDDEVFCDHFASVARTLEGQPEAMLACTGLIAHTTTADRAETRNLESARFDDGGSIVLVQGVGQLGRFVYRSALLRGVSGHLMRLLDGEEQSYFRLAGYLAGPLAQTNYATYVQTRPSRDTRRPAEPIDRQRQYIRDSFARDPRWLKAASLGSKLPEFVFQSSPGTPIPWHDYQPPASVGRRLVPDRAVPTVAGGEGLDYLVSGFAKPEPDHVWLDGERGVIEFALAPAEPDRLEDFSLSLSVAGRRSVETGRDQHVTLAVNGMVVGYAVVPEHPAELDIAIPRHLMRGVSSFRIEVTPDHADQVFNAAGHVIDARRLSVQLRALTLRRRLQAEPPVLAANERYRCSVGQPGAQALLSNFHPPEERFAWIAGRRGIVWFRLGGVPELPELRLELLARRSLASGEPPRIRLELNGTDLGSFQLLEGEQEMAVDVSAADLTARSVYLVIEASHAEAVYGDDHRILDPRLLAVGVLAFGVYDRSLSGHDEEPAPPSGAELAAAVVEDVAS